MPEGSAGGSPETRAKKGQTRTGLVPARPSPDTPAPERSLCGEPVPYPSFASALFADWHRIVRPKNPNEGKSQCAETGLPA